MIKRQSLRGLCVLSQALILLLMGVLSAQSHAANYQLEIIQPQPNLNTNNRFYKAYPGIEYNVRLAVIGGAYPYTYALTMAPQGMTIDKRGEISWPNPIAAGASYQVTASVTDVESTTKAVTWNVTVTKNGFRFIDAVNGKSAAQGGTGTFENPWKSIKDWYEGSDAAAATKNSYAGEFLYYRDGIYLVDGYIDPSNDNRLLCRDGNKPNVWLAYPGETPVIDFNNAYINYWEAQNLYIDGFEFAVNGNSRGMGLVVPGSNSHITVRRNRFHGITNGFSGGNNAHFFITATGPGKQGKYWSFQDNEFFDVNLGYGLLGYSAERVLFENNVLHNIGGHPVGPKEGTAMWFIRDNRFYANPDDAIGLQYSDSRGILSGDIEISFNYVADGGGRVRINSNQTANGKPVYVYRNTFLGSLVQVARPTSTNGKFHFSQNVIVNDTAYPDKIQQLNVQDASRVTVYDNLTGSKSDNIVDTQGNLMQNYSNFIGSRGYQIGNRPKPPSGVKVVAP